MANFSGVTMAPINSGNRVLKKNKCTEIANVDNKIFSKIKSRVGLINDMLHPGARVPVYSFKKLNAAYVCIRKISYKLFGNASAYIIKRKNSFNGYFDTGSDIKSIIGNRVVKYNISGFASVYKTSRNNLYYGTTSTDRCMAQNRTGVKAYQMLGGQIINNTQVKTANAPRAFPLENQWTRNSK